MNQYTKFFGQNLSCSNGKQPSRATATWTQKEPQREAPRWMCLGPSLLERWAQSHRVLVFAVTCSFMPEINTWGLGVSSGARKLLATCKCKEMAFHRTLPSPGEPKQAGLAKESCIPPLNLLYRSSLGGFP